tara:strand:- start:58 stop:597 length:540 start_codon:yes stop_codon:yes gene_type:complete
MSTLSVTTLQGLASSPTPTTIEVASGHNLKSPGSVVQVVTHSVTSGPTTFSANSMTNAITINFTPKFNNSLIKHTFWAKTDLDNTSYTKGQDCEWLRDSVVLGQQSWGNYFNRNTNPIADYYPTLTWHGTDTPNTTSQVAYKFNGRNYGGNGSNHSWVCFSNWNGNGARGAWTIEEIAQ